LATFGLDRRTDGYAGGRGRSLSCFSLGARALAIEPGDVRIITPRPLSPQNQGDVDAVITARIRASISSDQSLSNDGDGGIELVQVPRQAYGPVVTSKSEDDL
jgi:hypothetical protein